jgi:hypothetical protein
MKIALVFYGQARNVIVSYKSIYENIICNNDIDVFVHTWESNEYNDVIPTYNPTQIEIEKQINFNFFNENKQLYCPKSLNVASMFYSQQKGCEMVMQSGIVYDYIVRLRFDIHLHHKLDFTKLDKNSINVSEAAWAGSHLVDDCWMVSGYDVYKKVYSTIYDDLILHTSNFIDRAEGCKYLHYDRLNVVPIIKRKKILDFALYRDRNSPYSY